MTNSSSLVVMAVLVSAAAASAAAPLDRAITQLRDTHGHWEVTTEFLKADGSVARTVTGTYDFEWVVVDRILRGESVIPELGQRSGLLFYISESRGVIEMASVGADGHLWVMTGPADGETRTTADRLMPDGSTMRLRFTRFNISRDRFESRMEVSADRGTTWAPGNHQIFVRRPVAPAGAAPQAEVRS